MPKEATAQKDTAKKPETIVKLSNVRLRFPNLFVAKSVNGEGDPAYSATFIIGRDQKDVLDNLNKAIHTAAVNKWKDKADSVIKKLKLADKLPLHDGDMKTEYDGFEGNYYVSARTKIKPRIVDRQAQLVNASDGIPYDGCYVVASIAVWAQDNNFGQRVNASLRGVQFMKDGEAFSAGRPAGEDEFDEIAEEDGDDLA